MFLDDSPTSWDGVWPATDHPKGHAIWTIDSCTPWWNVDVWVHPFTRPFAALLEQNISLLKLTIENITQLMMPLGELQQSPQQLSVFKLVQVITRLNVAYKTWQDRGPLLENNQVRRFILEGFKGLPNHSGVATTQIIAVSKRDDPKGLESLLYQPSTTFKKPFTQNYPQRNFGRGRGRSFQATQSSGRGVRQYPQTKLICYNCGKSGHTKKACRLNKQHSHTNKPKLDPDPAH